MKIARLAPPILTLLLAATGCHDASGSQVTIGTQLKSSQPKTTNPVKPTGSPQWVRYTDNAEGAFSMDVPVGWQVEGGMYRFGFFDVRWMMDIRSLDGKVIIRINDPNIPPYVLPGPHSGPAGHPAIRPNMFQMFVDNYKEAKPFGDSYTRRRFASVCTSMTPTQADWTPTMPAAWHEDPPPVRITDASLAYNCETSDGPRIANAYAVTAIHGNDGLWMADLMITLLATPDRLQQARAMTQKMIDSWEETPQWKTHQEEMTRMGLDQMGRDFQTFMQQMAVYHQQRTEAMNQQVAGFEKRMQQQADQVTSFGNILTGVTNLYDPQTGMQFQEFSGPKSNYYMNGAGVKINSNLDPGNGFHQVVDLGP
ncbi:MAG TPA: hypothetical protein VKR52_13305 [Terracidiphilus sp.]|nr:hypothetical protein [Terracidiphilus sp.]